MRQVIPWILLFSACGSAQESRAIAYLAAEVQDWSRENGCFSCHNNGDGARALYIAQRAGWPVPGDALADTAKWLAEPTGWDKADANPAFHDVLLARIQFAAAIVESASRTGLLGAAESLLEHQENDGAWHIGAGATVGSPATYGTAMATYLTMRTLEAADRVRFAGAIGRAGEWLRSSATKSVPDCAAVLLATGSGECAGVLREGQNPDGGWGPWTKTPSEPYDTALALLALSKAGHRGPLEKGRAYLYNAQQPSGGWVETTRPAGGRSYAQHISTTAWALIALLQTKRDGLSGP